MDLRITGKRALVCASSQGLGFACAVSLAREGVAVTLNGRHAERLEQAAAKLLELVPGAHVQCAPGHLDTEQGRAAVLAILPDPDILVNNNGGPPPGDFRDWSHDDWLRALETNMLAPIAMARAVIDTMIGRRWGRIVNITSLAVKSPLPPLGLSNGARAGLTGFMAGLAQTVAPHGVTINNLLPGPFATQRMLQVQDRMGDSLRTPMDRMGRPEELGDACAFLCSESAAFMTGQNMLLDGGKISALL